MLAHSYRAAPAGRGGRITARTGVSGGGGPPLFRPARLAGCLRAPFAHAAESCPVAPACPLAGAARAALDLERDGGRCYYPGRCVRMSTSPAASARDQLPSALTISLVG